MDFRFLITLCFLIVDVQMYNGLSQYLKDFGQLLGISEENNEKDLGALQPVPYEASATDEKFISEAMKLTGIAMSKLDLCQQQVILKLKSECHSLNDEQLAKLAIHLLNCQSAIEGRKIYPCTDDMSVRDCTMNMDSDTWTVYHLMGNRAQAVCYMIRQIQFRGSAENAVNRLMQAAENQVEKMNKISETQTNIENVVHETFNTLTDGQDFLAKQQKDLESAQFHSQLVIGENIERLVNEKKIISETHNKLLLLTEDLKKKLEESSHELNSQNAMNRANHVQLINDLSKIQSQSTDIFNKIEASSDLLMRQRLEFQKQFQNTLKNLRDVNETVSALMLLFHKYQKNFEIRVEWISSALGGTGSDIERLEMILIHISIVLLMMLGCAFVGTGKGVRIIVFLLPVLNLIAGLYFQEHSLNPLNMIGAVIVVIVVQLLTKCLRDFRSTNTAKVHHLLEKDNLHLTEKLMTEIDISSASRYRQRSSTPNVISQKILCHGKTRLGTPCRLPASNGKDFCYKHDDFLDN